MRRIDNAGVCSPIRPPIRCSSNYREVCGVETPKEGTIRDFEEYIREMRDPEGGGLVEEALAADGAAETWDAVRGVHLAFELIIVCELLIYCQVSNACSTWSNQISYLARYRAKRR
jgi:hypothetical protein